MSLPLYLARHLTLAPAKRNTGGGLGIAIGGIALSVAVMILALSVMSGFRDEIRYKIMGFDSQITIVSRVAERDGNQWLRLSDLGNLPDRLPEGAVAELSTRQPAIMKSPQDFTGVVVRGIEPDHDWEFVARNLVEGVVPDYSADTTEFHAVVSRLTCEELGAGLSDRLDTYFLGGGIYRARRLKIVGIYDTHFSDYDRRMVYASMPMLRRVIGAPDSTAVLIEITGLPDDKTIDEFAAEAEDSLHMRMYTHPEATPLALANIHDTALLYFNWLALLDTNVAVLLTLMGLLAALTLVSSLFILVLRRVNMIGVLKAIGASNALIRRTFIVLTMRVLVAGLVAGNILALGLIMLQRSTGIIPLDPEAYYLDHVPMALDWWSIIVLNAAAIVVAVIVLILPSAIISTIPPSRAINYE